MFSDKLRQKYPCFKKERSDFEAECVNCGYGTFISVANKGSVGLLLFTRPLPRDGGMADDNGTSEAGQLPRVWTRDRRKTWSQQGVSGVKSP